MNGLKRIGAQTLLMAMIIVMAGCQQVKVKRVGMAIGIKRQRVSALPFDMEKASGKAFGYQR